ncbi:MAG TPA: SCO family protein [Streptosporangiaceae bacterium]|jgi:cytochrome oxidase Cu insertion factor (SCO1/SenC/PrrC family)
MPGMNSGLSDTNPVLVAAFRAALLHQGLIVLALLVLPCLALVAVREWVPSARPASGSRWLATELGWAGGAGEPGGRRLLRIGFGVLWIFDGILQAQPAMAAGLPGQVIEPTAASSPDWVQHVVNWAGTAWSFHPIQAGAAAVWIQIGIGAWLIAAPSGWPSRLAGLVSAGWGLVVWVFGEAFGGIFAHGLTFLFGAPGAAAFYCVAGLLIALPVRHWQSRRLGQQIVTGLGLLLAAMAVLQAWPGRGFWQGRLHGQLGTLASMVTGMSGTSQPHVLSALVGDFASLDAAHGFAVNLVAVIALGAVGAAFLSGRRSLVQPTLILLVAVCVVDWVLIEDLGFFGGLGTDPNSMLPVALVAVAGYLALARAPEAVTVAGPTIVAEPATVATVASDANSGSLRGRLDHALSGVGVRTVLALWAAAVVVVGAGPMAIAQASPNAAPIIAQAIDGSAAPLNFAAPGFALSDQHGRAVSLASLRGKVVLLTFLDPVCTSDCPLIAQEFRQADQMLGADSRNVEMVAIVANPVYRSVAYTRAFDAQEGLSRLPNWLFLTGSLAQLQQTWKNYAISAQVEAPGGMVAHDDLAYVIDTAGRTRAELNFNPGPGTASTKSSFAAELATAAQQIGRRA